MLKINKCPVGPKLPRDFLSRQQLAGPLQQHEQHLKRLRMQLHPESLPAQLSRGRVRFKNTKEIAPCWSCVRHVLASVTDYALNPEPSRNVQLFASLTAAITCNVRNNLQ